MTDLVRIGTDDVVGLPVTLADGTKFIIPVGIAVDVAGAPVSGGGGGGDASAANQVITNAALGAPSGAAVITDANGTIQQYLRGIIVQWAAYLARMPASLGSKAAASSLAVTDSTEDIARAGIITETAPASDTASSGQNGRLQRIAQRLTSMIALLPTALAANGGLKVEGVAGGVAQPVSGPQTNTEFLAALRSTGTHSSVASGTASVTILASNANRKGARIFNTDANALYLDLSGGTAVAATRAQVKLATETGFDVPAGLTGTITGLWAADGAGVASVVEFA